LPFIGSQDTTCWGANFAWAVQYAVTAGDVYTNNRPDANRAAVSAQYFLDCSSNNRPFTCKDDFSNRFSNYDLRSMFLKKNLPLVNEWKGGYVTGTPGSCSNGVSESKLEQ
jgi:hypothetical protein